ncbi:outer membrane protein [Bartonella bilalgolemii]|uniref:Outer membrane beta-barrel protein n=1 Tax=Bartonella bilalgolemii TaxID=2942911 RepID=A0ABT0P9Z8_9HYPH|nr:outer membrane beta-barrel protein [Bartonella sp. G70]MCL6230266.1 outer membrane beta-barrel protein [Bartonella sp. G70]
MYPYQSSIISPIISSPAFSWTGFYFGGKVGGFLGYATSNLIDKSGVEYDINKNQSLPKLSGIVSGLYAGSNIDINNGFVFGFDTNIGWYGAKDIKIIDIDNFLQNYGGADVKDVVEIDFAIKQILQQKWLGATRVRIGFGFDRVMPYVAGGVSYTHFQSIYSKSPLPLRSNALSEKSGEPSIVRVSKSVSDAKIMTGYTIGGGLDFAMTDNFVLRAEYNYSDFGKKKIINNRIKISHKINDFSVGVAYKF